MVAQIRPATPAPQVTSYTVVVTPELAKAWLATTFERQRHLRDEHVEFLIDMLRRDTFEVAAIQFRVLPDGTKKLIDGQHRLTAIARSGIPAPLVVIEKRVETAEEIGAQYGRLDKGISRSLRDSLRANESLDGLGLSEHDIRPSSAAMTLVLSGFQPLGRRAFIRKDADVRVQAIAEWAPEIRAYLDATARSRVKGRFRLAAPMSVGLVTFRYQPELAATFWRTAAEGSRLEAGQPELVLREYLMLNASARREVAVVARVVAGCWNAAFEGRLFVRRPNERADIAPIKILGTPYDGARVIVPDYV